MAFLNTPMADVWKATKRTFTDFMDVDGPNRSSTGSGSHNVRPNVKANRPRPSTKVRQERGTDEHVRRIGTGEHRFNPNQHQRVERNRNANESRTVIQTTVASTYPNIQKSVEVGQDGPHNTPRNVKESNVKHQFAKSNVRSNRMSPSPVGADSNTRPTQSSSKLHPNDSDDTYLNRSQTEPELGLYPQFATFQPQEPTTVSSDAPVLIPGNHTLELEEHSLHVRNNVVSPNFLTVDRPSRSRGQKQRQRYRSSSSDRATDLKGLQRRPSYDKSKTIRPTAVRSDEEDDDWLEQAEKVKLRFMSMWNNVKYGWTVKTKTPFNIHKAIWLLGKCYHHKPEDPDLDKIHPGLNNVRSPAMELFKQDFVSRIWLTYRREFPQLSGSTLTTDCGWGCMLRSGQMLLAQALILHFLGRDWNLYKGQTLESEKLHRQIIQWFGDQPSDMSPFSLHHLVEIGKRGGKRAGDWFGPASVAHIIKEAVDRAPELNPLLDNVCIYVSQDCTVYKQDVIDLCTKKRKKSLKPIYHDVPEKTSHDGDSSGRGSTSSNVSGNEHEQRTDPAMARLQSNNYNKITRTSYPGGKNVNMENLCNKESPLDGKQESLKDKGSMQNHGTEVMRMDESFADVLDKFTSEFEGYSSNKKEVQCGKTVTDNRNENIHVGSSGNVNSTELPSGNIHSSNALCPQSQAILPQNKTEAIRSPGWDVNKTFQADDSLSGAPSVVTPSKKEPNRTEAQHTDKHVFIDENKRLENACSEDQKTTSIQEGAQKEEEEATHTNNSNSPTEELSSDWCAVIVLVPVRLGGEEVNGIYIRPIQSLFSMTNCIGIIGGKPRHSLYFVGFQDEKLIHLDPHYCQSVVDMKDKDFPIWSFHCMSPRKMSITKMDPSCTIGFYLQTREDFDKFCVEIQQVINPPGNGKDYPMFIIREGRCRDWNAQHDLSSKSERYLRVRHVNEDGTLIAPVTASEDFVLLD